MNYAIDFQIEWLKAGTHHPKAKEWLEGLPERYPSIKDCLDNLEQEKFQLFCNIITQGDFFSHYFLQESTQSTKSPNKIEKNTQFMERPNKNNKSALGAKRLALGIKVEEKEMASLESKILNLDRQNDLIKRPGLLMRIYDEHKSHEPYLSSEEINLKSLWASKKFKDFGMPSNEEKEKNGIDEFNDRQFKHAVYFLHTLNTPLALEKLGIIYEIGQPDTPQDYPKAADYYRRSKTSFSYQRLVTLYKEGHLGKIDYQEVVNIHELSEDTDYLKIQII